MQRVEPLEFDFATIYRISFLSTFAISSAVSMLTPLHDGRGAIDLILSAYYVLPVLV